MKMDRALFEYINSYKVPELITEVAAYVHGYKHIEVAFFLFCFVLASIFLSSPKKGVKAASVVFVAAVASFFGSRYLQTVLERPFPYLDATLNFQLRVEPLTTLSAAPLTSVTVVSAASVALIYYFPKYSMLVLISSILYSLLPIHLGVAFPSDAFGSLFLGYLCTYVSLSLIGNRGYFKRF